MNDDNDISIEVATDYIDAQSEPDICRYVFAYTITIANRGNVPARLMSRHWIITDHRLPARRRAGRGLPDHGHRDRDLLRDRVRVEPGLPGRL